MSESESDESVCVQIREDCDQDGERQMISVVVDGLPSAAAESGFTDVMTSKMVRKV